MPAVDGPLRWKPTIEQLDSWRPWCRDFDSKVANPIPTKVGDLGDLRRFAAKTVTASRPPTPGVPLLPPSPPRSLSHANPTHLPQGIGRERRRSVVRRAGHRGTG